MQEHQHPSDAYQAHHEHGPGNLRLVEVRLDAEQEGHADDGDDLEGGHADVEAVQDLEAPRGELCLEKAGWIFVVCTRIFLWKYKPLDMPGRV